MTRAIVMGRTSGAPTLPRNGGCRGALTVGVFVALVSQIGQAYGQDRAAADQAWRPPLPAGAVRVVAVARRGHRFAVCAEEPGSPVEHGTRQVPRTRVWVHDGQAYRQMATIPGTCDPAWSPDGDALAVAAPDGIWVVSADLTKTTHLVDVRHSDAPADETAHRVVSRPGWSPDAGSLAFLESNGATSWVRVVQVKTAETIYTSDPETYEFVWGPDSRSLHLGSRVVRLP